MAWQDESSNWGDATKQRMRGGANDNPNVATFLKNTQSLRVQRAVSMRPIRGNCRRERQCELEVDDTPLPKRRRCSRKK